MADALAIFLQSRFDASGIKMAEQELSNLNKQLANIKGTSQLFQKDPVQFLGRSEEGLKATEAQIASLKQMSQVLNDAAKGALRLQDSLSAKTFVQRKGLIDAEIKSLESLISEEDRLKLALDRGNMAQGVSIPIIQARVEQLRNEAKMLREAAQAEATRGGDGTKRAQDFLAQAAAQDRAAESLKKLTDQRFVDTGVTQEQSGKIKVQSTLMKVLGSTFNQLGFTMFVTASTARMFFQIFETGFKTFSEGAAILDRENAFNQLLSGEGIDASGLIGKLQSASQGTIPLDLAIKKSLQLAKAGFPEIAAQSDDLLKIAVNSALVSGELDQVETIYDKLIRGIIRGSPRLIDDADIILKLGDSNEKYAESLGKTVEQLTAAEKVQATFNAVIQEGQRINEMADQLDSASLAYQQLKTSATDAGNAIKEALAIGAASAGEGGLTAFLGSAAEQARLGNQLTQTIREIKEENGGLALTLQQTSLNLSDNTEAWTLFAKAVVNGTLVEQDYNRILDATRGKSKLTAEETLALVQSLVDLQTEANSADNALFNMIDGLNAAATTTIDLASIVNTAQESFVKFRSDILETGLAFIDVQEQMLEAEQAFGDKMSDLRSDMSQKMRDITADLGEKMIDISESYNDKIADIEQDLADKREDIQRDLADKLSDISSDIQEKRESEYSKHTQKIEDIETDHQKRIAEIMAQFEMSRTKALIDRDALGLFEAERRRDEDLRSAEESAQEKRQTETDEYRKTTQDLAAEEAKRRQQAQEEAEKRRQDAQRAATRARQDAQEAYEKGLKDAQEDAEKRRAETIKDYAQQQKDAVDNYAKQKADFANWNTERLREQQQAALNRQFQQLQDQIEEEGLTQEHIASLTKLWTEYQKFVSGLDLTPSGNGGGTTPGDGTQPSPSPAPPPSDGTDNIAPGAYCSVSSSRGYRGNDGEIYFCVNHVWTHISKVFPSGTNSAPTGASGGVATASGVLGTGQAVPSTVQRIPVTIQATGDRTLEEIFKSLSYEAFVEIMS